MQSIRTVLLLMLGAQWLLADLSIQNIEKMVDDIRAKRTSKMKDASLVVSPFIVIQKDENRSIITPVVDKVSKTNFKLGAIVNQSAFIDGAWKKRGDTVGEFKVDSISGDHVVLKRKNRTITLYFRKTKQLLKLR